MIQLIAYELYQNHGLILEPATQHRQWMDETSYHFANRCLPMLIANQHGWIVRNNARFTATWNGLATTDSIEIKYNDPTSIERAKSHFGHGILTWNLPWLFRTSPGYNLWVRGPANAPKDGIQALEGIVETDWLQSTFTLNWKFTRIDYPIVFEKDEIIAFLMPVQRGFIESVMPEIQPIAANPELEANYRAWSTRRLEFNATLDTPDWQRDYFLGRDIDGSPFEEHQTKLRVSPFRTGQ
jgi:hypothetical protein